MSPHTIADGFFFFFLPIAHSFVQFGLCIDTQPPSLTPNPDIRPCLVLVCMCLNCALKLGLKDEQRCSRAKNKALVSLECCLWRSK